MNPVAFLGSGIHTCLGRGMDSNIAALSGHPMPPEEITSTATPEPLALPYKLLAGRPVNCGERWLYDATEDVIAQAIEAAHLTASEVAAMNLYLGSSSFDISLTEVAYARELAADADTALALRDPSFARLADTLANRLHLGGSNFSFNTACTASANALLTAASHVSLGLIEHALVIGVELYNEITALGFSGLDLLTRDIMKPFDDERNGLVLGEAVSATIIGRANNTTHLHLLGGATRCDTHSISASEPTGSTIEGVIRSALHDAGLDTDDVGAIKAHGTASLSNDEAEAAGMHRSFPTLPNICAIKPHIGHTLGACGLTEALLCAAAAEQNFLIGTQGISKHPGELGVALNQHARPLPEGALLLNYFGFGGNNTALVLGPQRAD